MISLRGRGRGTDVDHCLNPEGGKAGRVLFLQVCSVFYYRWAAVQMRMVQDPAL